MGIFTATIGTASCEVYGGLTACAAYLGFSSSEGAAAFRALDPDEQTRRLVDATRYIDDQFWQGAATGLADNVATTLAFPRAGLTDVTGAPLDPTNVPDQVVRAAFEMAAILAADTSAAAAVDSGSNISSLGAGPAQIAFFRPTSAVDGNATVLPTVVDRLIGRWRAAAAARFAGFASGGSSSSDFRSCSSCGSSPCCCDGGQRRDVGWPV